MISSSHSVWKTSTQTVLHTLTPSDSISQRLSLQHETIHIPKPSDAKQGSNRFCTSLFTASILTWENCANIQIIKVKLEIKYKIKILHV